MDLTETEDCLGVGRKIVKDMVDSGLLHIMHTWGQKQCYSREEVGALRARAATAREAEALFHLRLDDIRRLVQQQLLPPPISGPGVNNHGRYLFDRQDLLNWQAQYVSYLELSALVKSRAILSAMLKVHHVEPVSRSPTTYRREEALAAIADRLKT